MSLVSYLCSIPQYNEVLTSLLRSYGATYSIQVYRTRYFTLVGRVVNTFVVGTGFEPVCLP